MPVSLTFEFLELDPSRSINFSQKSASQKFSFLIKGNFRQWATENGYDDPTFGPDDDIGMVKAIWMFIPEFRLLPLKDNSDAMLFGNVIDLTPVVSDVWRVEVEYSTPDGDGQSPGNNNQLDPNTDYDEWSQRFVQVSMNASTEEETRTQSLKVLAMQLNQNISGLPPYVQNKPGPIGLTEDGVEGVQVYARSMEFTLTTYMTPYEANLAYNRVLFRMAGTLNLNTFFGFPAQSVLFLSGNANLQNPYSLVPVELNFKMRPNFKFSQTGPTALCDPFQDNPNLMFDVFYDPDFTSTGTGPAPGGAFSGWSHVEYIYNKVVEASSSFLVQKPAARGIHQNYELSNFAYLKVGGGPPV